MTEQVEGTIAAQELQALIEQIDAREDDLRVRIAAEKERANAEMTSQLDGVVGDGADYAGARIRAGIENEMVERHLMDLSALEAARQRIKAGTYGVCVDDVARLLADEAARDRRVDRDAALLDVGLVVADDLVHRRGLALFLQLDGRAEHAAAVGVEQLGIDHLRVAELRLELRDAALDEALLLARRVVFGVLREVAVRARLGNHLAHMRPLDGLQALQLRAQQLGASRGHRGFRHKWSVKRVSGACGGGPGAGRARGARAISCRCRPPAPPRSWCSR